MCPGRRWSAGFAGMTLLVIQQPSAQQAVPAASSWSWKRHPRERLRPGFQLRSSREDLHFPVLAGHSQGTCLPSTRVWSNPEEVPSEPPPRETGSILTLGLAKPPDFVSFILNMVHLNLSLRFHGAPRMVSQNSCHFYLKKTFPNCISPSPLPLPKPPHTCHEDRQKGSFLLAHVLQAHPPPPVSSLHANPSLQNTH